VGAGGRNPSVQMSGALIFVKENSGIVDTFQDRVNLKTITFRIFFVIVSALVIMVAVLHIYDDITAVRVA
jgi:hypothetical protein